MSKVEEQQIFNEYGVLVDSEIRGLLRSISGLCDDIVRVAASRGPQSVPFGLLIRALESEALTEVSVTMGEDRIVYAVSGRRKQGKEE